MAYSANIRHNQLPVFSAAEGSNAYQEGWQGHYALLPARISEHLKIEDPMK